MRGGLDRDFAPPARRRTVRTWTMGHILATSFACGFNWGCGNADPAAGDRIEADFATHTYDRRIFRAEGAPRGPAFGRWDLTGEGLRAVRPRGELDRPPLRFAGMFGLEGDFEVTAQFSIGKLPRPKTKVASNRVAILLQGPDRAASLFRAADSGRDGYSYEIHDAQIVSESEKPFVPTRANTGRLRAQRRGTAMTFWRGEGGGPFEQIGSSEFGSGPVTEVAFLADAQNSGDDFDVRFDRIEILADRIKRHGPSSGEETLSWASIMGLFAAGTIAILIIRRWRNSR